MTFEAENKYKAEIVSELFVHEGIRLPSTVTLSGSEGSVPEKEQMLRAAQHDGLQVVTAGDEWHYRNKMEYSFWGDDDGLHLALHLRGSHGKQIVQGSELALPALDKAANAILAELNKLHPRAGDLKTIIVRCSQKGEVVAALYTKLDSFTKIVLPSEAKGLRVYRSNPKSPASVPTKLLYELGDCTLQDDVLGKPFAYDVDSFFQVNLPVYDKALTRIKEYVQPEPVDMYAGVGSIGLSVGSRQLIELDPATAAMARLNAQDSGAEVVEASTEKALEYIVSDKPVIFDPPRAGLHQKVVERCLEVKPPQIIYLSCNPATQARDLALLQEKYTIDFFETYNFFPRTPHIETLAILKRKSR
ncbi:MAG: hypothetical protein WDN27_03425 [Candidatus Saccharibacteria bacterium]